MKIPALPQILRLHEQILSFFGGGTGVRDIGLAESAVNAPSAVFSGREFYATLEEKAARLGWGLVSNHAFVDGNKRIGAHAMLVTLRLNGVNLEYTQNELVSIIMDTASGKAGYENLLEWIINHKQK